MSMPKHDAFSGKKKATYFMHDYRISRLMPLIVDNACANASFQMPPATITFSIRPQEVAYVGRGITYIQDDISFDCISFPAALVSRDDDGPKPHIFTHISPMMGTQPHFDGASFFGDISHH